MSLSDSPARPDGEASNIVAKEKWYRGGLCFSCTQCGNCCSGAPGYVWVTKEEIRRISKLLGREDGWLGKTHLRRVRLRYSLTEKPSGDCVFLKRRGETFECSIYAVRPLQCRTWPFWSQNLRSPDTWNEAHQTCPGINTGKHRDFVEIETVRTQKRG